MSRHSRRRGPFALLALAAGGVIVATLGSSVRVRTAISALWSKRDGAGDVQELAYMELPDAPAGRAAGRDDVDRAIADGFAIAAALASDSSAAAATVGAEGF